VVGSVPNRPHHDRRRSVPAVLPVFLVVGVMMAFIGVPVFLSWWRNRG
jgi:hypothetical protein